MNIIQFLLRRNESVTPISNPTKRENIILTLQVAALGGMVLGLAVMDFIVIFKI